MPHATITEDTALKHRLAAIAGQNGQRVSWSTSCCGGSPTCASIAAGPSFHRAQELPRSRSKMSTASPTANSIQRGWSPGRQRAGALLVPEHQHHATSMNWFTREAGQRGWATCSVTEFGVICVCTQLPGGAWLPEPTADRLLLLSAAGRKHVFWARCPVAGGHAGSAHRDHGEADQGPVCARLGATTWRTPGHLRPRARCNGRG